MDVSMISKEINRAFIAGEITRNQAAKLHALFSVQGAITNASASGSGDLAKGTLEKQLQLLSERSERLAADNIGDLVAASYAILRIANVLSRWDVAAFSCGDQARG